jgi:pimeloyl-ACP methyl ester carboxylesterase
MSRNPDMQAVAPTMPYDFEIMGDFSGGTIPEDIVRAIDIPTLVIAGGASPEFFRDTATRIAALLSHGEHIVLEGQDHGAPADVVAPVVAKFFAA